MIYYLIGTFAWIQLILAHLFFNGCIFIRLERHLWNTDQWYGPWILLLKIFVGNKKGNLIKLYFEFIAA